MRLSDGRPPLLDATRRKKTASNPTPIAPDDSRRTNPNGAHKFCRIKHLPPIPSPANLRFASGTRPAYFGMYFVGLRTNSLRQSLLQK